MATTTNKNLITSPVGGIQFLAAGKPVTDKKTGKESYSINLLFDLKKDKGFLDTIAALNDAKVVTAQTYRGKNEAIKATLAQGKARVEAKSNFKPTVYDTAGNELEEAPMFFQDSEGTAQMIVQPYSSDKGGTINLVGIIIHSLSSPEKSTGDGVDRESRLAQLRAAVEAATKG
jgi:hypothetical protein